MSLRRLNLPLYTILVWTFLLAGCETAYRPTLTRLDPVGLNSTKAVAGNLAIYVEEYASAAKSERAFDTNLVEEGVLPLLILLENRGNEPCEITLVQVSTQTGALLQPLSPSETASKAKRHFAREAIGWSLVVPILTIPVAAGLSTANTVSVNTKISQDLSRKAFGQEIVQPGKHQNGFLFYQLEEHRKSLSGLTFELTARNQYTRETNTVLIPLPDIAVRRN